MSKYVKDLVIQDLKRRLDGVDDAVLEQAAERLRRSRRSDRRQKIGVEERVITDSWRSLRS